MYVLQPIKVWFKKKTKKNILEVIDWEIRGSNRLDWKIQSLNKIFNENDQNKKLKKNWKKIYM